MKLKDHVAVITGSGRGIGKSIAAAFGREGAHVVICDINEEDLNSVFRELTAQRVNAAALKADISEGEEVKKLVTATMDKFGKIDILVNNAGIIDAHPLEETPEDVWDRVVNVNLKGVFLCSMMFGKIMIQQKRGNIMSLASTSGYAPYQGTNAYSVTKAGVRMLMKQVAVEWGKYNIRANSISPGLIRTPMSEKSYANPEIYRKRVEVIPIKRIGSPEDIAKVAVFLASEDSSYITGEDIAVDGGLVQTVFQQVPGRTSS